MSPDSLLNRWVRPLHAYVCIYSAIEAADGRESVILEVLLDHDAVLCGGEIAILGDFIEGRNRET